VISKIAMAGKIVFWLRILSISRSIRISPTKDLRIPPDQKQVSHILQTKLGRFQLVLVNVFDTSKQCFLTVAEALPIVHRDPVIVLRKDDDNKGGDSRKYLNFLASAPNA
jgi:hypothetical protein